ncbi:hybrid sensor histidine kinase/response regulator [Desulfovibrio oxyclinae]|uniref:hybrid sensor histidine kinase/response regulator n=1 Tax=Desulfovibrio oxyclinae TaxID=63560 RepID=UPI0003732A38|nr:ATP-binding protein [Desulfovibrio oxyclinae]
MPRFRGFRSISSQLTYGFIILAVICVFTSGGLLLTIAHKYTSQDRQRLLSLEGRLAAERISGYSESLFNRLNYLANIPDLMALPQDSVRSLLEGLKRLNSAYTALCVADLEGNPVAKAGRDVPPRLPRNEVFAMAARSRFNAIGPLEVLQDEDVPAIEVAVPIRDNAGVTNGIFWARINLKYLMLVLGDLPIGRTGYGYILDDRNFGIALDVRGEPVLKKLENDRLEERLSRGLGYGARGEPYTGLRGEKVLGTMSPVTSLGLRLVVEMPQAEVNRPQRIMINAMVATLLVLGVLGGISAYLYSRRVVTPLNTLTRAVEQVGRGDLSTSIGYDSSNELGILARNFNTMTSRLRELLQSLNEEIRERRQAEQALRLAEQRYRSIFERAQEGIVQADPEGGFIMANPAAARIFNFDTPEELVEYSKRHPENFYVDPSQRTKFIETLKMGLSVEGSEIEMIRRNGEHIWVYILAQPTLNDDGQLQRIDATFQDVTERHKAEDALAELNANLERTVEQRTQDLFLKAQELEEANHRLRQLDKMKSAFLSSVSHELRTPLTSILGFAKLIRKEFQRTFSKTCKEDGDLERKAYRIVKNLQVVEKEGDRLTRLVNEVLDLNKIESGKVDWHYEEVDVEELIGHAASLVRGQFSGKPGVELHAHASPGLPLLQVDRDRMTQVLINLLSNAEKFTDSGMVTIRATGSGSNFIRIEVTDTGRGIPEEELEAIFDKFQQVRQGDTLRSSQQGTGLGLAISRNIVEHHGGRIWAESRVDEGSTFIIELPLTYVPEERLPDMLMPDASAPLVLIVDDDAGQRHYLSGILIRAGFRVETAGDGGTALRMARRMRPDIITMDIMMPGMDGIETVEWLRKDPELADIPVIALTIVQDKSRNIGQASLSKPVAPQPLIDTINDLLSNRDKKQ